MNSILAIQRILMYQTPVTKITVPVSIGNGIILGDRKKSANNLFELFPYSTSKFLALSILYSFVTQW